MTAPTSYQAGPFDSTHIYVQWGGLLPGEETWSCGFRMWKAGGSTPSDATGIAVGVAAAIRAFHIRAGSKISPLAIHQFVKVNAIGTNGRYQDEGTTEITYADAGGTGTQQYSPANQIALAVSTVTGFNRGVAHRGRFYLPLPCTSVGSDGRIFESDAEEVKTSANTLRTEVNAAGDGHVMTVMSRKAGAPGHRAITGFEVGLVLDTQRRRRRSLLEAYV